MAATFIVEDGSGKADANSYITVADADAYVENHGTETAWIGATQAAKEKALRLATQYIDLKFNFKGTRNSETQALLWPRFNVYDNDGYNVDYDAIPQKLKDAVVEAALRVIAGDDLLGTISNPGEIKSESKSLGPLSKSVTYVGGKPASGIKLYPRIKALLSSLIQSNTLMQRG